VDELTTHFISMVLSELGDWSQTVVQSNQLILIRGLHMI